ncbi:Crp/Fnr family transcriptional regulator [Ensifer sp. IC3342]|nr:Crp/Fnr family transcriptional regulator [Ensifer sp. BRP08]MCA1450487.1 Crp/Fnr family transcriptional regulator [Ensifer sp. IC3342]
MATKNLAAKRSRHPSFSPLGSDLAAIDTEWHLRRFGRVKHFEADSVLFGNGKTPFALGVMVDGVLAVRRLRRNGNNRILQFLGPNDFVYPTLCSHPDIEVETLTPATIRCLNPAQLSAALNSDPELANAVLAAATSQLQSCLGQIAFMSERPIDRLGFFLLRAIYRPFDHDRTVVSIQRNPIAVVTINRTALAAHIGITTTNLAYLLLALQEEGIIRALTPRRFEILEEARLAACCGYSRAREHLTPSL